MQPVYDNDAFFTSYAAMPRSREGLEAAGEWHQLAPLFPALHGKTVLDLGCGYGWHCKHAVKLGVVSVLGLDASEKMLAQAAAINADERITYRLCGIEDYDYPAAQYDLVLSNLALHYIADLEQVYRNVYRTLKPGGCFLFNIEHPVFTAGVRQDWIYSEDGIPLYWPVDRYFEPGERETDFLGHKVIKQHHTLTQILNTLIRAGFTLEAVEEAMPSAQMLQLPGMADELRRPMMLLVKAAKHT